LSSGEQEHWACLCTAGNSHLLHTLNQGNLMKMLGSTKGPEGNVSLLDELSASGEDNPVLCGNFSEC